MGRLLRQQEAAPSLQLRLVTSFLTARLGDLSDGWMLMLAFGLAHSAAPQVPAFGYWICVFVSFVLAGIVAGPVGRRDMIRNGKLV